MNADWPHTAIDRFVLAALEARSLEPQPEADRRTLIRRVSFDLTGLPPTPQQMQAFLSDRRPDAYERLVERLLASPAYGQRWAQHWLDLARFAETDGYEHDKLRPDAWRYRDWLIAALNEDLPYDRFVQWQLAGDELAPDDPRARVATAFCLSGPDMPDINSQEERRHTLLNEITATVGNVILGLQFGCAQCHDHKYDPISQADFYRLRAFFEPAVKVQRNRSIGLMSEQTADAPPGRLMIRGDWRRPGPFVEPAFPRIVNPQAARVPPPAPGASTSGRRAALARWLTGPQHPLTGRVIANRLWHHHFGRGLSATPSDFGTMGDEPTHPELLDWLATELVRQDWSLKSLHRLIVTSAVYRQASRLTHDASSVAAAAYRKALERDAANLWLARFPRRRLEGEAIRDAQLAVAGMLSTRVGGPGVRPPLPTELLATLLKDHWQVSADPEDHFRRSVYVFARRNLRYPVFEVFDRPDANASCGRRDRSTTAPQSLWLLNSQLSWDAAGRLAARLTKPSGTLAGQVDAAFRWTLSRPPTDEELTASLEFLGEQSGRIAAESASDSPPREALRDLCLALLNFSEFVYLD